VSGAVDPELACVLTCLLRCLSGAMGSCSVCLEQGSIGNIVRAKVESGGRSAASTARVLDRLDTYVLAMS
jgi:hypothetical protein